MEITTTRGPEGSVSTRTMGPEIPAGPSLSPSVGNSRLSEYLDWMLREKQKQYYASQAPPSNQGTGAKMERPRETPQYTPQLGSAQPQAKQAPRQSRTRRVRRLNSAIPIGMDAAGITYDDLPEYQLEDGSWSLDAVRGTLKGNEAAVQGINEQRNLNPTGYMPMNMSGGMTVIPPREKK